MTLLFTHVPHLAGWIKCQSMQTNLNSIQINHGKSLEKWYGIRRYAITSVALCKWILCRFCWFSPTWGCCGMSPAVSTIAESPRNERIGPSTLICAAVRLHRRSDNDSTTRQRWSMSGRNPGFNRILKEIHQNGLSHYALRQTTKFCCVKLCTYLLRAAAKLSKSLANLECLIDF